MDIASRRGQSFSHRPETLVILFSVLITELNQLLIVLLLVLALPDDDGCHPVCLIVFVVYKSADAVLL